MHQPRQQQPPADAQWERLRAIWPQLDAGARDALVEAAKCHVASAELCDECLEPKTTCPACDALGCQYCERCNCER